MADADALDLIAPLLAERLETALDLAASKDLGDHLQQIEEACQDAQALARVGMLVRRRA